MRAQDLDLRELLHVNPEGGVIRFGDERALILDAVALGILRRELVETCGAEIARGVLTRFGFAHGWRTAESLRNAYPWDDLDEWRGAGGRIHTLTGLVIVEPTEKTGGPFAESLWRESFEAEQHLLQLGLAREPVCWTLCGFASGYLSYAHGKQIYFLETRCRGKGDACCQVVGKTREEWGAEIEPHIPAYCPDSVDEALRRATEALKRAEGRLRSRTRALARAAGADALVEGGAGGLIARSEAMRRVLDLARRLAKVDATVLLTGESGVGKERLARLVHDESARAAAPFVAVNCGALPESLLESELFGHARGAFTGATEERVGLLEAANRGTILLDEIGEVTPAVQVKLLRALQEREVRRVGENRTRKVHVRVLAATNKDLRAEVEAGRFREDLYYRLRVVEVRIPPLRERRDDILPLARALLDEAARRLGRKLSGLSPEAAGALQRWRWPGNVRELRNAVERAAALAEGPRVEARDLPEEVIGVPPGRPALDLVAGPERTLEDIEREAILATLAAHGGSRVQTAEALSIGEATLRRKLRGYRKSGELRESPGARGGPGAFPETRS
jgi:DNA-binding NtrC family response regulator